MSVVFAIILFSLLIFVHELGHFLTAKLSGVQVNEFSMFMGPALWKKQIGETLYSVRCIPFGGYCAMEGEDSDSDNPKAFGNARWWKRLAILVAGSAMNFIAGFLILAIVFAPSDAYIVPEIAMMEENCALAENDGLRVGDRFLEINGEKVYVQSDFSTLIALAGGDTHDLLIERDGQELFFDDFKMEMRMFPDGQGGESLRYGFSFGTEEATFGRWISYTWNNCLNFVRSVRLSLAMIVKGQAGLADMTGPVGIVQMMSDTAEQSATPLYAVLNMLYLGGFIAVNLAVMNMLPIPALDGGRVLALLLTTAIEKVSGKKVNPKVEAYIHGAGMVLLLALMAVIMFKDVFTIFKG